MNTIADAANKRIVILAVSALLLTTGWSRAAEQDKLVGEALGASAGAVLYNTLTLTGILSDLVGKNLYKDEQILALLDEQKKFMGLIHSYMTRLVALPPQNAPGDAHLSGIAASAKQMNDMIDALIAYIKAPDKAKADVYVAKRRATVENLKKLLG